MCIRDSDITRKPTVWRVCRAVGRREPYNLLLESKTYYTQNDDSIRLTQGASGRNMGDVYKRQTYHRENPGEGDNYFVDVYRFELDFKESDVQIPVSYTHLRVHIYGKISAFFISRYDIL